MCLFFHSYHSNLDKEDFCLPCFSSTSVVPAGDKVQPKRWMDEQSKSADVWMGSLFGRGTAPVHSGEQISTLTRCSGLTLPNTIKTDDDEDTAVTWKQHDDCLTPSVSFLFGLINVHCGTKTPCDRAQESLTQISQLEWITAPWSTSSPSQLRQSLIETRP